MFKRIFLFAALMFLASVLYSQTTPTVISGTCLTVEPNVPYTCVMTASGGKLPYHWSIPALPHGLTAKISTDTTTLTISGTQIVHIPLPPKNLKVQGK
jgi:hypothetical protein